MSSTAMEWQTRARDQFEALLLNIALAWKAEQDKLAGAIQAGSREQFATTLNLGLRRLRQVSSTSELATLAVELAAGYGDKIAFFLFEEGSARAQAMRNLGQLALEFSPNEAAAFQTAIETQDPVVSMNTPTEISPTLADRLASENAERVYLFPMPVHHEVKAVLLASGNVQPATLELVAGMAAIQMETFHRPISTANGFVSITPAAPSTAAQPAPNAWDALSPELQALHLKAQRKARLRVAEIQIEHSQALQRGRAKSDLYTELQQPIDLARDEFRRDFIHSSGTMVDYLYLELIRGLAQGDDHLLGPAFPGPLI